MVAAVSIRAHEALSCDKCFGVTHFYVRCRSALSPIVRLWEIIWSTFAVRKIERLRDLDFEGNRISVIGLFCAGQGPQV